MGKATNLWELCKASIPCAGGGGRPGFKASSALENKKSFRQAKLSLVRQAGQERVLPLSQHFCTDPARNPLLRVPLRKWLLGPPVACPAQHSSPGRPWAAPDTRRKAGWCQPHKDLTGNGVQAGTDEGGPSKGPGPRPSRAGKELPTEHSANTVPSTSAAAALSRGAATLSTPDSRGLHSLLRPPHTQEPPSRPTARCLQTGYRRLPQPGFRHLSLFPA
ncbi:UNVERIFIED_CONTAM: hypothetical protein K2H54_032016 [Gekko kuhli]